MAQKIAKRWELLKSGTSWRPLTSPGNEDIFRQYDAVIVSTSQGRGGRGNSYEIYTFGSIIGERDSLFAAKTLVEDTYGTLDWKRKSIDPVKIFHNYYGPTEEFSEPTTVYVVDKLPPL